MVRVLANPIFVFYIFLTGLEPRASHAFLAFCHAGHIISPGRIDLECAVCSQPYPDISDRSGSCYVRP